MIGIYSAAVAAAAPVVRLILLASPRHRPLLQRFRPPVPSNIDRPVWIHACSVGEVGVAIALVRALQARRPHLSLLLTVSTTTGRARAGEAFSGTAPITWFPFDLAATVREFFEAVRPRALILIETELWPNVLREAAARNIPVALVNGRISDRHVARYRRARALFRPAVRTLSLAAMQNQEYVRRIVALGADASITFASGNIKFDAAPNAADPAAADALRAQMGIPNGAPVVVFGSTRPGDEALARACWDRVRARVPNAVFVVAPRHLQRVNDAQKPFADQSLLVRSEVVAGRPPNRERIILIDTHGELTAFYALADVAVIGGSFSKDVQGHNPIEPAALGVSVLFGPHMRNFKDAAAMLLESGGAVETSVDGLPQDLEALLGDPDHRNRMGQRARQVVAEQTGATERTLNLLLPILDRTDASISG